MGFLSPLPHIGLGSGPPSPPSGYRSPLPALWAYSEALPPGTEDVDGSVQSQNATIAGMVNRFTLRDVSGAVQSQSASASGTVLADKIVSGAVQSQSASVSGAVTAYPLAGWSLTTFTVDYAGLDPDSPYTDPAYSDIVIGDKSHYETLTDPDGHTMTMDGLGEYTISPTTLTQPQTFDHQIYDASDGTFGAIETITVYPSDADVSLDGGVQSQNATVSGSVNSFTIEQLSGAVQSQDATVSGVVNTDAGDTVFLFGGVQSQGSTVSGSVDRAITTSGNLQSQLATISGNLSKVVKASGSLQSQSASVSGIVIQRRAHSVAAASRTVSVAKEKRLLIINHEKRQF